MAKPPASLRELTAAFGPHLNYTPAGGWREESTHPYSLVKTHCCFCGQQCGIQLKVEAENNRVIGFEPWEDFPYNKGMLCPKGVKRYLQGEHPDRLKRSLLRGPDGFREISYGEALDHTARVVRAEQISLDLHQQIVRRGSAVHAQLLETDARILLHCAQQIG